MRQKPIKENFHTRRVVRIQSRSIIKCSNSVEPHAGNEAPVICSVPSNKSNG